jgi:hypothetical protein
VLADELEAATDDELPGGTGMTLVAQAGLHRKPCGLDGGFHPDPSGNRGYAIMASENGRGSYPHGRPDAPGCARMPRHGGSAPYAELPRSARMPLARTKPWTC